jgi:cobalt-zinc-cadmium efflux system protein
LAQHWSSKPRTERSTYGFQRAEVLAAFLNGAVLAVTAAFILKEALHRWATPQLVWGKGVVITAAAGLAVNLAAAGILSRAKGRSLNVRAAFAHLIADSLGSVAAISAGLAVLLFGAYRADPALSALIALLIAFSGWRVLKETTAILLEAAPPHLDVAAIERTILDSPGVVDLHDLHVWRISDRFDALTVHVTLERGKHGIEVCHTVTERLRKEHGLYHVTVQPEAPPPDEVVHVRSRRDGGPIGKVG